MTIEEVFKQQEPDMALVEKELDKVFESSVVLIPAIGRHVLGSGGKRLRPLYLLLSSALAGYRGEARFVFASIIEAIHTASLLHDDVVDEAHVRRGQPTSHSIWGNQVVVLVGDFLYANSLRLAVDQHDLPALEAISYAATKMTEGEILQLHKVGDPAITEDEYLQIISCKTGALISASCRIGGLLAGLSTDKVDALTSYGIKSGLVFQMYDDILDFKADEETLGKKLGKDLYEGKITLPLIYLLREANEREKEEVTEIIKTSDDDRSPQEVAKDLKTILDLFKKYDVIDKALDKTGKIVEEAKSELRLFADCPQKDALLAMADYAMQRKK